MTELPKGWGSSALKDVCTLITDGSHFSPPTTDTGYPYITVRDLGEKGIDFKGCKFISEEAYKELVKNGCQPTVDDVLFSKDGTVGKVAIVPSEHRFVVLSSLAILRPEKTLVHPEFLKVAMLSPRVLENALGMKTGTAIRRIVLRNLKTIEIPVPSLAEQERIVEILEEQLSRLESALASIKAVCEKAQAFRRSLLHSAFSGELTGGTEGWREVTWGDILADHKNGFRRGPFGSALRKEFFVASGFRVYEQSNAIQNDCTLGRYFITSEKYKELERFSVEAGDFLISCSGTIGRMTEIPEKYEQGVINQALLRVRLDKNAIISLFFRYLFVSPIFQEGMLANSTGTAIKNVKGVSELKSIRFALPPLAIQERIISVLEEQFSRLDNALEVTNQLEARIVSERRSLLHAAFTGELTAKWRDANV